MLQKSFFVFLVLFAFGCAKEKDLVFLSSPDGQIKVNFQLTEEGQATYSIQVGDSIILEPSRLGLVAEETDLSKALEVGKIYPVESISDQYTLVHGKKLECSYEANSRTVSFLSKNGLQLQVTFQLSNDGLAFRYELNGEEEKVHRINTETSTFNFPSSARAWLHPHAVAQSGWEHTQPSYEENYEIDIPVGTPSTLGQGWSFPALFRSAGHWVLLSETDMGRDYCGSHLGHSSENGEYQIAFPQAPETMGEDQPLFPQSPGTIYSPWRTILIGESLGRVVESTMATDLSTPSKIEDVSFIQPGKSSWSWVLLKDDSTVYEVQKRFIDYAADMNWQYCLVDCFWDTQIGYDSLAALAQYAQSKGIGLLVWYNSNGNWNTAPLTPKNRVTDPEIRKEEFAWLKKIGVKGLKIDFFGGDGQSFMNYYQDLIEDAAKYELVVNFHGATIPRGWTRTYPNLVTMESVKGMEFLTFEQANTDRGPQHCTVLPFTRNAIGPMDFTPVCFSEIPGLQRKSTNGFELALSVLFQSGVQHYAETPQGMARQPNYVVDFLKALPITWEDIKFIDGYPGKFAILARKGAGKWYVAGINGENLEREVQIDLAKWGLPSVGTLITDGESNRDFSIAPISNRLDFIMKPRGGFSLVLSEK